MSSSRYSRNRIYLSNNDQKIIKDFPIIMGGSGIGSVIAECALRLGFECITIIDGDKVESSNLNRQNYTEHDVDSNKTDAIKKRLLSINKEAKIKVFNVFLDKQNLEKYIKGHKVAINALDFSSDIPLLFDKMCQNFNIPVLHPYNVGWGGLLTVVSPNGLSLEALRRSEEPFSEVNMVQYASNYLSFWGTPQNWINDIIEDYKNEEEILSPPQLSIASWLVAGMCTQVLYNIATEKKFKKFPEFYLSTLMNS